MTFGWVVHEQVKAQERMGGTEGGDVDCSSAGEDLVEEEFD